MESPWYGGCVEQSLADGGGVRAEKIRRRSSFWVVGVGRELFVVVELGGSRAAIFVNIFSTQKKKTSVFKFWLRFANALGGPDAFAQACCTPFA